MVDRSYFRYVLADNFKVLTWILILFIIITPNFLFMRSANAAVGGWTISNPVAQGASTAYDGAKQVIIDGKDYIKKGTAIVTPTATGVAKVLAKGVAGVALSVAVEQLLGAVDWVLDPANNQIKYTETDPNASPNPALFPLYYVNSEIQNKKFYTPSQASAGALEFWISLGLNDRKIASSGYVNNNSEIMVIWCFKYETSCTSSMPFSGLANPAYDPNAVDEKEEKTLPLETVAAQVISNAEGNTDRKVGAQVATGAAAADIVAEAEADQTGVKARPIVQQLENTASTKPADETAAAQDATATGTAKPQVDPVTGEAAPPTDIALKFPMLCGLMPVVCEAAQKSVNFMSDYEPDEFDGDISVSDQNIMFDDSKRFNFSSGCPASEKFSVSFFGATQNLEFSYTPLCDFMSMIKPFVIGGSYLIGAYIVMGLSRGSAD